ncbi:PAAR domain-containing protein [Acinetobacter vivianii]|uniref:PAAR domain-containing protein n=1 Tax=Acinetobacter vivianii TaxID=1776742 RepID=UPI002DBAEF20|nr:PAAR domain-containing protein [Acinetobacter vivianii]MEB6478630.1 PAAR domain-containing protein [Acinetobacter vivianii]MEB6657539.1 PAAR domain-containing protein [Acinetobacter vivianii]
MPTRYIVVGCPTTGGGKVITGNRNFLVNGQAIACIGDEATCSKHTGVSIIITGDSTTQLGGRSVARIHDSLSCGCKLLQPEEA